MQKIGYKTLANEYDTFYHKKNYSKEVSFLSNLLKHHQVKTILDVGCGTGTHMSLLEQQGFQCTGLDLNSEMLKVAQTKVKGPLHAADMTCFSLSQTFDAIICMFAVFNHNLILTHAKKTLSCFKKHLKPGGLLLIDLYHSKNSGHKIDQGNEITRIMQWTYDPATQITSTSIQYKNANGNEFNDPFSLRHYPMEEMQDLLQNDNFVNIQFRDNFSEIQGSHESKNLILTAFRDS